MLKTQAIVLVIHEPSKRGFTYNEDWELLEPLILKSIPPTKFRNMWLGWLPNKAGRLPRWAEGKRDHEFTAYFFR